MPPLVSANRTNVFLRPALGSVVVAELAESSLRSSRILCPPHAILALGACGNLCLSAGRDSSEIPVTVVERVEGKRGRLYGLRHDVDRRFLDQLPAAIRRMLDQRASRRHRVTTPTRAHMRAPDGETFLEGRLVDIARDGACVLQSTVADELFGPWDRFDVSFRIGSTAFAFQAGVRRRELSLRGTAYGLQFLESTPNFSEQQQRLTQLLGE